MLYKNSAHLPQVCNTVPNELLKTTNELLYLFEHSFFHNNKPQ